MADYQAFRRISSGVPAIIIEVGFMNLTRPMLTQQPDRVAGGITDGIWCFLDQIRSGVSRAAVRYPPGRRLVCTGASRHRQACDA